MADVTVKQLAQVVGIPVERLLNQLQEAGLSINDEQQTVNEDQKRILLSHLKGGASRDMAAAPERITLRRKSVSQVTLGHDAHSGKTVNIEVRKKRTYEKRSNLPELAEEVAFEEEPVVEDVVTEVPPTIVEEVLDNPELPTIAVDTADQDQTVVTAESAVESNVAPVATLEIPEPIVSEGDTKKESTSSTDDNKAGKKKQVVKESTESSKVSTNLHHGKNMIKTHTTNVISLNVVRVMKNLKNTVRQKNR